MMNRVPRWTACLMGMLLSPASAADIRVEAKPHPGPVMIHLEGKIVTGDLPRMENKLDEIAKQKPKAEIVLALNSPGGDHFEGLRIALLLRRKGVGTVLLPGSTCWSACSSIFFGGYNLQAGKPNRVVHETARLGVHQMTFTDGKPVPEHVHKRVFNAAQRFLVDMEISSRMQGKLFETDPKDIYVLTAADMAGSNITVRTAH